MRTALILIAAALLSPIAYGADIYVPDDHAKIQDAINAAVDGDTVIVRPGTYVENIDFIGKAITVKSENGADATVIDGNQSGSVVSFVNAEGRDSIIEGFTITNGSGTVLDPFCTVGGGIYCKASSPTIRDNIVTNNDLSALISFGVGISCENGDPLIEGNVISRNKGDLWSDAGDGGGIYVYGAGTIRNNIIDGNGAVEDGGGVSCNGGACLVENNVITNNDCGNAFFYGGYGGGISCSDADITIRGNLISGNDGSLGGGGIYCRWGTATIEGNTITDNYTLFLPFGPGGGIYCRDLTTAKISRNVIARNKADRATGGGLNCDECSNTVIDNNLIIDNVADTRGGGVMFSKCTPVFINNTVVGNTATDGGGGCTGGLTGGPVHMVNNIFWQNQAPIGTEIYLYATGEFTVSYSDVQGGQAAAYVESGSTLNWGAGNIDADPLFADSAADDYHLILPSPCRNTGDNSAVTEPLDFEADPRIHDGTVDMGADEFHLHLYSIGDIIPGSPIDVKVVGNLGTTPVGLGLGSGIQDPPITTIYGDLYLQFPMLMRFLMPDIGSDGLSILSGSVPSFWLPGEQYPFQALAGSELTNLMVLTVE